jgi:threonine dehydrogenase-like Zn-dependent dehydrogenase
MSHSCGKTPMAGLQAEYARAPFADNSVYKVPEQLTDEQVLFLADILPTSYEVGVLNGMVSPGDVVAIVGAGPIGLAAVLTAKPLRPRRHEGRLRHVCGGRHDQRAQGRPLRSREL